MALSNADKKHYRQIGHSLNPIVMIAGNGLSEGVIAELERALDDHELIKVKLAITDRDTRKALITEIVQHTNAELVQDIGKTALLLRLAKKPKLKTSKIRS